ncbi:hypothetical protein LXL04_008327 [Taraxacum kok-saghyz]
MDKRLTYGNTVGNLKDDAKKMDPLFPRLHISDADKGAHRTSARNKTALSQQPVLPPLSTSGLVPTYHDSSYKRSVFSSFGSSYGSTRLATQLDSYRSSGINLNISLTTVKQTIETTNCQTLCNTGNLKPGDYCLFNPQDLKTRKSASIKKLEDDDHDEDYLVPSLSFGNANRGKLATSSPNCLIKQENKQDNLMIKDINAKEHVPCYSNNRTRFSETLTAEVPPLSPIKKRIVVDDPEMLHDSTIRLPLKRKNFQETTSYEDGIPIWPFIGEQETDRDVREVLSPVDNGSLQITPDEVSQIIGHDEYCKTRRTIIQQQRVFRSQLFELHRLIKVQRRLAESAHFLLEDRGYNLPKNNMPSNSEPIDSTIKTQFHTKNDTERRYNTSFIDLPQSSTTVKQPPWCLLPPPGNQWLVPMTSPSEGLVYKPYTGPCPPPVGLMAPLYGMGLTPTSRDFITSAYNPQGIGVFPNNPIYPSYGLPPITKGFCSPLMEDNVKNNEPVKTSCNTLSLEKWPNIGEVQNVEGGKESDLQGSSNGGDELQLFPTTPMVQDSDRCTGEKGFGERIKAIKAVPHNPKLASESAARIFQFIQEERKQNE